MFKVKDQQGNIIKVYAVQALINYTYFLIYADNKWTWVNSCSYAPYDEENVEKQYIPVPYIPTVAPNTPNPLDDWWTKPYVTWSNENINKQ